MEKSTKEILKICNEFLQIPSTTGFEKPFLNYLNEKISKLGYKTILSKESLVVVGKNPKILFSSHIDRQGLILNENGKLEYAAFYNKKKIGGKFQRELDDEKEHELIKELNQKLNEERVKINGDYLRIKNKEETFFKFLRSGNSDFFEKVALRYIREKIISYDINTGKKINHFKTIRYDLDLDKKEVTFEIDKKLGKEDKIFMLDSKINITENKFSGQIDNVISAALLFYLLKNTDFKDEIIFTTGEEYGNSWQCVVDYSKQMQNSDAKLIVLDTSPYPNLGIHSEGFLTLRNGDENGGFNIELVNEIKSYLEKEKIAFDFKPSFMGKTELGRISSETKGKVNGATLQLPTTNYHTTFETATLKSLENYLKIICKLSSD